MKLDATNVTGYSKAIQGLNLRQAELVLSTKGLNKAEQEAILTKAGLLSTTGKLTTAELEAILVTKKRNKDQAEALLINTGLITSQTAEATATNVVTAAKLKELVQTKKLTQAEAELIAAKAGVTLANQKESASFFATIGTKIKGAGTALKSVGTGILTLASAHPIIAGITVAITALGGAAIVNKIQQEKAAKAIKEAYDEAKQSIESINQTYNDNTAKTKEIAKEYAELAQGVDLLSNSNRNLSTEKYERFLELSNDLSTLYPSLTKRYDENGNAILDLSGDVDTIVGSLDNLIARQRDLANQEIVDKMPDLFAGYSNNVTEFEKSAKEAEKTRDSIQNAYEQIEKYGLYTAFDLQGNAKDKNKKFVALKMGEYISLLKELGVTAKQANIKDSMNRTIGYMLQLEDGSSIPNITGIYESYVSAYNKAVDDIKYANQQLAAETISINQYLNTWLQTEFSYNQVADSGLQTAIQEMLFNFDWNTLPEGINRNDWEAVSEYLRRNILFAINNAQDNPEIANAISQIYSNPDLTPDEKADFIKQVQDFFGTNNAVTIALNPVLEDTTTLQNQYNAAINEFKDQDLSAYFKENSINDESEIDYWNKVTEGATSAAQAVEMYEKAQQEANSIKLRWDDPSSIFEESEDKTKTPTLVDLESQAGALASFKKEIDEGAKYVSVSALKSVFEQYPEAKKAISDYEQNLISQTQLFDKLKNYYEDDVTAYLERLADESKADDEFWTAVYNQSIELQNLLGNGYDTDVEHFATATEAKELVYKRSINKLKEEYADYLNYVIQGEDGLYRLMNQDELLSDNIHEGDSAAAEILGDWDTARNSEEYKNLESLINQINKDNTLIDKEIEEFLRKNRDYSFDVFGNGGSGSNNSSSKNNYDWIERLIQKIQRAYEELERTISDTTLSWEDRNKALADSMHPILEEIEAQNKAYGVYMSIADSVGLDEHYKNLIKNGNYSIDTITDENLREKIDEFKEWYDKALAAKDAVEELHKTYRSLTSQRADFLESQYEQELGIIDAQSQSLNNGLDILEAKGLMVSSKLYDTLIKVEEDNINTLQNKYDALTNNLNEGIASGSVKVGTEEWYNLKSAINDVSLELQGATKNLIDYKNEQRQLAWDVFDKTRDEVQGLVDESDFLYTLLEDKGLANEETGMLNEYGDAAQALIAQKYNLYFNQAEHYADAIEEIDREILDNPTDQKLVERKNELVEAQRDAIASALEEKNAIKDLISEGYDAYINSLNEIIDKYKDLMNTMKDAYDYENQMSEKADNLAKLQKQYSAYANDDSEAGMKVRQELAVQIKDAEKDIKDTEYDRMISDTEKLLDQLMIDTEAWVDEQLTKIDQDINTVIESVNNNSEAIANTLKETSESVGTTLSDKMQEIWSGTDGEKDILASYKEDFLAQDTILNNTVDDIKQLVQDLVDAANKEAEAIKDQTDKITEGNETLKDKPSSDVSSGSSSGGTSGSSSTNSSANNDTSSSGSNSDSKSDDKKPSTVKGIVNWIKKRDFFPKSKLNTQTSVVDRLKYNNIDSSFAARAQYYSEMGLSGTYTSKPEQNIAMLDWMKKNKDKIPSYRKGSLFAKTLNGMAWTNEDGAEIIRRSDGAILTPVGNGGAVFNSEMTSKLWEFAKNPPDFLGSMFNGITVSQPNRSNTQNIDVGGFNIQVVANNPQEFAQQMREVMAKDTKAQNMIREIGLGGAFGNNSLNVNRYK